MSVLLSRILPLAPATGGERFKSSSALCDGVPVLLLCSEPLLFCGASVVVLLNLLALGALVLESAVEAVGVGVGMEMATGAAVAEVTKGDCLRFEPEAPKNLATRFKKEGPLLEGERGRSSLAFFLDEAVGSPCTVERAAVWRVKDNPAVS